jgi:two-component system CheB/CheR fusion protein
VLASLQKAELPYLVGIGASAGGLEALTQLIKHLPLNLGCSYVIVQHLSPTYKSMLVQLLSRETELSVIEVTQPTIPKPNFIYITPASHNIVVSNKKLKLTELKEGVVPRPSINAFFQSLAQSYGEKAVGVILSGTGSDGSLGIKEIKLGNGYVFAQDPSTAKYKGMPQAAIDTGIVDYVLSPQGIAGELSVLVQNKDGRSEQVKISPPSLSQLLAKVYQETKIDFSGYKDTTLSRRIERRMVACKCGDLTDYINYVVKNPLELTKLSKDILISVTSFFRDADSFKKLENIFSQILQSKKPGDEIRVWVPGCATGEEAYSVAIMILEKLGDRAVDYKIQVFATDIDLEAMQHARKGIYSLAALAEVDIHLISKYFLISGNFYETKKILRETVVFARQDLIQDPPFLRLDLISCRNILIYFQPHIQAKLLDVFHYALNSAGILFLGRSETISQQERLFSVITKEARIFKPKDVSRRPPIMSGVGYNSAIIERNSNTEKEPVKSKENLLLDVLNSHFLPVAIIVDNNYEIKHIHGDATKFLSITSGKPNFDLLHIIRKEFRADLQTLVHKATKDECKASGRIRKLKFADSSENFRLTVIPAKSNDVTNYFIIAFEHNFSSVSYDAQQDSHPDQILGYKGLEDELVATREHLQTVIEELETSNEEMQALNEEVQASNEELQSSNEELESTNEELQSTNEELTSINEELTVKTVELEEVNKYLENIQNSLGFPMMVVDAQLNIVRYNRLAGQLFALPVEQHISKLDKLNLPLDMPPFIDEVKMVIASAKSHGFDVSFAKHFYKIQIEPVVAFPQASSGAVITVIDNTTIINHSRQMKELQDRLLAIMNHSESLISLKDLAGKYMFVNQEFQRFFSVTEQEIYGKTDRLLFERKIAAQIRDSDISVLKDFKTITKEEVFQNNDKNRYLNTIRFPLYNDKGEVYAICTQSRDITEHKASIREQELAAKVFEGASDAIVILNHDFKVITVNPSYTKITGYRVEDIQGKTSPVIAYLNKTVKKTNFKEEIEKRGSWAGEISFIKPDGQVIYLRVALTQVKDVIANNVIHIGIFNDITETKNSQHQIEHLATHDSLTGLANRNLLAAHLEQKIAVSKRNNKKFLVMFIDLDNFKFINDSKGHHVGDIVLQVVGKRIKETLRSSDIIARLGGDEFAVVIDDLPMAKLKVISAKLVESIGEPIRLEEGWVIVTASIGVCVYPDSGDSAAELLKNADIAMYHSKDSGKNTFSFFKSEMKLVAAERLSLENDIRVAIQKSQFRMVYQPQINLITREIVGLEALIRWDHPEKGLIPPSEFIPFAEKVGLIDSISFWVFDHVFHQIYNWLAERVDVPLVSINLSPKNFKHSDVKVFIEKLCSKYPNVKNLFGIEITETALMEDLASASSALKVFKSYGAQVSLDDFGTGYSSFIHLKKYPIDFIKIDRSFVDGISDKSDDLEITKAIISVSHSLGLKCVAEGVETSAQLSMLQELGCDRAQGYFIAKPMKANELAIWLNKYQKE